MRQCARADLTSCAGGGCFDPLDQINLSLNSSRLQTVPSRPSLVQRYRNDPLQVSGNSLVGPFLTHGWTLVLREALQTATSGSSSFRGARAGGKREGRDPPPVAQPDADRRPSQNRSLVVNCLHGSGVPASTASTGPLDGSLPNVQRQHAEPPRSVCRPFYSNVE